jgi:subtilisin family serine protease
MKSGENPQAVLAQAGCTLRRRIPATDLVLAAFTYDSHASYAQRMNALREHGGVISAESDAVVRMASRKNATAASREPAGVAATAAQGLQAYNAITAVRQEFAAAAPVSAAAASPQPRKRFPNDPLFAQQWNLHNTGQNITPDGIYGPALADSDIDAPEAWTITTGSRAVRVAVVDDGMSINHEDLRANVWTNPGESGRDTQGRDKATNGVDDDGNGYVDDVHGYDVADDDADVRSFRDTSYGTMCAGILGAVGDNGLGGAGVCWSVSLIPVKTQNAEDGTSLAKVVEAIYYASSTEASIVNLSFCELDDWETGFDEGRGRHVLDTEVWKKCMLDSRQMLIVVSASNNGGTSIDDRVTWPASDTSPHIIAVAGSNHRDRLSPRSAFGVRSVDLTAPGGTMIFPRFDLAGYDQNHGGTDVAGAQVAGVAALLKSHRPELTAAQIKQAILGSVDVKPGLYGKVVSGGRLNAYRALQAVADPDKLAETYPLLSLTSVTTSEGARSNGNGIIDPGEQVKIGVVIRSSGTTRLQSIQGRLLIKSGDASVIDGAFDFGTVKIDKQVAKTFSLQTSADAGEPIQVSLRFEDASGQTWSFPLTIGLATTLSGVVTNSRGERIAGARVKVRGNQPGIAHSSFWRLVTTDSQGRYRVDTPGLVSADVTAVASGYNINVWPGQQFLKGPPVFNMVLLKPVIDLAPVELSSVRQGTAAGFTHGVATITSAGIDPLQPLVSVRYADDMSSGLWHETTRRGFSGGNSFWCGREDTGTYERNYSALEVADWIHQLGYNPYQSGVSSSLVAAIKLPSSRSRLTLRSWLSSEKNRDMASIWIAPRTGTTVPSLADSLWQNLYETSSNRPLWTLLDMPVQGRENQKFWLRFQFDPDESRSNFEGWYVDDVTVGGSPVTDWLPMVNPTLGDIPAGEQRQLRITAGAKLLPAGRYDFLLEAVSNDPLRPLVTKPLTWLIAEPVTAAPSLPRANQ